MAHVARAEIAVKPARGRNGPGGCQGRRGAARTVGSGGALADRDVEDLALRLIAGERGADIGLDRIGDVAEVAAGLAVAVDLDGPRRAVIADSHFGITAA